MGNLSIPLMEFVSIRVPKSLGVKSALSIPLMEF